MNSRGQHVELFTRIWQYFSTGSDADLKPDDISLLHLPHVFALQTLRLVDFAFKTACARRLMFRDKNPAENIARGSRGFPPRVSIFPCSNRWWYRTKLRSRTLDATKYVKSKNNRSVILLYGSGLQEYSYFIRLFHHISAIEWDGVKYRILQ